MEVLKLSKGSKQRPIEDKKKFDENWDKIFKKPPSCIDSAYERKAVIEGLNKNPVFPENQVK